VSKMSLEEIGRREVVRRLFARREGEMHRRIVRCVMQHVHASAHELQERLLKILNERPDVSDAAVAAEIEKLAPLDARD
jgi:hypothetical protein